MAETGQIVTHAGNGFVKPVPPIGQTNMKTEPKFTPLIVTDYRCPVCGGTELLIPAGWGVQTEPKTGIPACVACGTEFWMDGAEYVEWYTNPPAFPATLFGADGRIVHMVRDDSDDRTFVHPDTVVRCDRCGDTSGWCPIHA